ncbi:MAG: VOC family protein [Chitinophagales bacterium]|nr:VOC family protein [Chitinophagales bacterium]
MDYNVVGWFEIPVTDMDRALRFYENVFQVKMQRQQFGDEDMAWFPFIEGKGASGSLVKQPEFYRPSKDGILIYFTAPEGITPELERVKENGGTVLLDRKLIAEDIGYMALFLDTEGNRIALHSRQ